MGCKSKKKKKWFHSRFLWLLFWNNFHTLQFTLPFTIKKINKNVHGFHPWMTKGLLISRCKKISLCKSSIKHPSANIISIYKNYRNLYAKIIRASKKLFYEQQLAKYQSDCKKTWQILRKAINNSNKSVNSIKKHHRRWTIYW